MGLEEFLKNKMGFDQFRPGQKEVIEDVLSGYDVFARLPTGTGKTLCYLMSGWLLGGLTLIVSPLLSLMEDQVRQIKLLGEKKVAALTSLITYDEKIEILNHLSDLRFLILSPEMLQWDGVTRALNKNGVRLLVVDEAHCISQWGHDFRPDYLKLSTIKQTIGSPPTLALTATADTRVVEDILQNLDIAGCKRHLYSVDRPNIALKVESVPSTFKKYDRLIDLVRELTGPGLIYFSSREATELASDLIRRKTEGHIRSAFYHAGMSGEDRLFIQNQFLNDQLDVVCSTNAFGMGLNKPNIRYVVHFHYPQNLNAYVQEMGRAGRDGLPSLAITLITPEDHQLPEAMIERDFPKLTQIKAIFNEARELGWTAEAFYKSVIKCGGSETAARFLSEQAEQLNPTAFEESERILIKEIEKRKRQKYYDLGSMRKWLTTEICRREALLSQYDEPKIGKQSSCCDLCGLDLTHFNSDLFFEKRAQSLIEPWEDRLRGLLPYSESKIGVH